ncbi:hypothetical protein B296_00023459 [Ensete ventricosum]|uniref:Uncharacterized protein n=1 Tax=Ensete ventricosum TaxID=4639 RepID=A0A427AV64_ENSVE|nr:hypothetical protein B296_00023459 [Ensete ventricosum]
MPCCGPSSYYKSAAPAPPSLVGKQPAAPQPSAEPSPPEAATALRCAVVAHRRPRQLQPPVACLRCAVVAAAMHTVTPSSTNVVLPLAVVARVVLSSLTTSAASASVVSAGSPNFCHERLSPVDLGHSQVCCNF